MIPGKTDTRWQQVVTGTKEFQLTNFATKMLLMRVRMLTKSQQTPEKLKEAIDIAHDFFVKNESVVADDLIILFGK